MENLITLPTAKLAKEKGFNLYSPAYYTCDNPASGKPGNQLSIKGYAKWIDLGDEDSQEGTLIYSAPTQSMLQKWIREIHHIHVHVNSYAFGYYPLHDNTPTPLESWEIDRRWENNTAQHKTYEAALEEGLIKALELIKLDEH